MASTITALVGTGGATSGRGGRFASGGVGGRIVAEEGLGAGCTYSAQYYEAKGQFHKSNPKPGDQIFFTDDGGKTMYHTGLVVGVSNNRVYTIEGNSNNMVRQNSYPVGYGEIKGYGVVLP